MYKYFVQTLDKSFSCRIYIVTIKHWQNGTIVIVTNYRVRYNYEAMVSNHLLSRLYLTVKTFFLLVCTRLVHSVTWNYWFWGDKYLVIRWQSWNICNKQQNRTIVRSSFSDFIQFWIKEIAWRYNIYSWVVIVLNRSLIFMYMFYFCVQVFF